MCSTQVKLQKVDEHLRISHKLKFPMKSLTSSCLICALNVNFIQKILKNAKLIWSSKKLLQAPTLIPKYNGDRPSDFTILRVALKA